MRFESGCEVDQVVPVDAGRTLIENAFLNPRERLTRRARFTTLPTLLIARLFSFFDLVVEHPVSLLNGLATLFCFRSVRGAPESLSILSRDLSLPLNSCGVRGV
jgi:hypothetical protein